MNYDELAPAYDTLFTRPVDHWEDRRLEAILRGFTDGRKVLDLGCGTGWVADHCSPLIYTGCDDSAPMLAELSRKHPWAQTIKCEIGELGWTRAVPGEYDVITATWALQYLFAPGSAAGLSRLLAGCAGLTAQGGVVALHGYLPRYRHRRHYCRWPRVVPPVVYPEQVVSATVGTGLSGPRLIGMGALPDWMAHSERLWEIALNWPAGHHYSGLWIWSKP